MTRVQSGSPSAAIASGASRILAEIHPWLCVLPVFQPVFQPARGTHLGRHGTVHRPAFAGSDGSHSGLDPTIPDLRPQAPDAEEKRLRSAGFPPRRCSVRIEASAPKSLGHADDDDRRTVAPVVDGIASGPGLRQVSVPFAPQRLNRHRGRGAGCDAVIDGQGDLVRPRPVRPECRSGGRRPSQGRPAMGRFGH